jgi:hypothetical protein
MKYLLLVLCFYALAVTLYSSWLRQRLTVTQRMLDDERRLRRTEAGDEPSRRKR